jgi:integral membrane protein (TIGR00529 family)
LTLPRGEAFITRMDILLAIPALVKVGLALGLVLVLNRIRVQLGLALMAGGVFLGFFMGLGPGAVASGIVHSLLDAQTISLILIVVVILALSRIMAESGQLERIVDSFGGLIRSVRVVSLVMPALIGLLPMPGGALFSAPMVETACKHAEAGAEVKTAINYWFRHVWEYWWPLYPGVVLAVSLLGVQAGKYMLLVAPLTLVSVGAGVVFLLPFVSQTPEGAEATANSRKSTFREFRREVRPITFLVLTLPLVKLVEVGIGRTFPPLTSVFVGLAVCLAMVVWQNRLTGAKVFHAVFNKAALPMLLLVFGIMVFKGLLLESQAVASIRDELVQYNIPPMVAILLLPFISGFVTGIALGFVGASFPLVVPLLAGKTGLDFMAHAGLAYTFGYMGMMMSPVHLCFLVTKDFFSASLLKSYRYIIGPVVLTLIGAGVWFAIIQLLI